MSMKVKILVGYHKPAQLLKDDIFVPIHLGRAVAKEVSKDGQINNSDYAWMCENMIGDDTGDNISHLNRSFCEMSGIYWAWKNYDKLGDPDFIGFMHYRRIFDFAKIANHDDITSLTALRSKHPKCLSKENVLSALDGIVVMNRSKCSNTNPYEYFKKYHIISDLDLALEIIKSKFSKLAEFIEQYCFDEKV